MDARRALATARTAADHYLVKVPQRMPVQAMAGLMLILGSHALSEADERAWMRDAGTAIVAFALTRWLGQQGRRRTRPDGKPVRNPTLRFKLPEGP